MVHGRRMTENTELGITQKEAVTDYFKAPSQHILKELKKPPTFRTASPRE
jgi:hypothetical protein